MLALTVLPEGKHITLLYKHFLKKGMHIQLSYRYTLPNYKQYLHKDASLNKMTSYQILIHSSMYIYTHM